MQGSIRIPLLASAVVCVFALTSTSAFALPDQLFTQGVGGVELRDTNTTTANQPSAIEWVNAGTTKLEVLDVATSECTEGAFSAFVATNTGPTDPAGDPTLSVPSGVFENCTIASGTVNAPVYVDTAGTGAGVDADILATINDDGAPNPINVVLEGLALSLYVKGPTETICKFKGAGPGGAITGAWVNGAGPFVEEASTNQTLVDFKGQELSGECNGTAVKAKLTAANFFVETTSDSKDFSGNSDTVFFRG